MFLIIGIFLIGIAAGYLLRRKAKVHEYSAKLINILVFVLLFSLGVSVGNNSSLTDNLVAIGFHAVLISLFAMGGSILTGIVYNRMIRKHEE